MSFKYPEGEYRNPRHCFVCFFWRKPFSLKPGTLEGFCTFEKPYYICGLGNACKCFKEVSLRTEQKRRGVKLCNI